MKDAQTLYLGTVEALLDELGDIAKTYGSNYVGGSSPARLEVVIYGNSTMTFHLRSIESYSGKNKLRFIIEKDA